MDAWQSSTTKRLGQLHADNGNLADGLDSNFKWLIAVYGAGFVLVMGAVVASYLLLADKIAALPH